MQERKAPPGQRQTQRGGGLGGSRGGAAMADGGGRQKRIMTQPIVRAPSSGSGRRDGASFA